MEIEGIEEIEEIEEIEITHRPLYQFAGTIKRNWDNMDATAKKLVDRMFNMNQVTEDAEVEELSARETVKGFLLNSHRWRGELARQVKRELKEIIK